MSDKSEIPDNIPSHPIVPVRVEPSEKQRFITAATDDGKALGTWFKWLARRRISEKKKEE